MKNIRVIRVVVYCFAIAGLLTTLYFGPRPVRYSNIANEDILQHIGNVPKASRVLEAGDKLLCFGRMEAMRDMVPA